MSGREIAGILLAAGTSSRMGTNKLFLELEGETLLRRAVRAGIAAGLEPLIVVLGHESERARPQIEGLCCQAIVNARYREGMNTSVSAGVSAVDENAAAAVVMLADMPYVTAAMIRRVASSWAGEPLVVSLYGEVVAPPILYARSLFSSLRALQGSEGGKGVVDAHRPEAVEVRWPAEALQDLDVPADLERVRSAMRS